MMKHSTIIMISLIILIGSMWPVLNEQERGDEIVLKQRKADRLERFLSLKDIQLDESIWTLEDERDIKVEVQFITSLNGNRFMIDDRERKALSRGQNVFLLRTGEHELRYHVDGQWKSITFQVPDEELVVFDLEFERSPDEHSLSIADDFEDKLLPKMNEMSRVYLDEDIQFKVKALSSIYHLNEHYTKLHFQALRNGLELQEGPDLYFELKVDDRYQVLMEDGSLEDPILVFKEMIHRLRAMRKNGEVPVLDLAAF